MAKGKEKPEEPKDKKAPAEEGGEESSPKKSGKLKLILIVVIALAVGGGGAFAAMKFLGGGDKAEVAAVAPTGGEKAAPPAEGEEPITAPPREGAAAAPPPAEGGHGAAPAEGAEGAAVPAGPQVVEMKPFIVNLNDAGGKRFLKLTMSMKVDTPEVSEELTNNMPQIRDTILLLLSSLSYDDISTMDGKLRLRSQMLNRANTLMTTGKIREIYFSEFVVQ